MLLLEDVSKQFKAGKPIISGYSNSFKPGEGIGLIGANGSGKTTFLRLLSVSSFPTSGTITWNGNSIYNKPQGYLKDVGLVHDEEVLPRHLSAFELLEWILRSRKAWNEHSASNINAIFNRLALAERNELIGTYSTGMKKKAQIAAAMIVNPKILIMDEPLRGLDVSTRNTVSQLIIEEKERNTLVLMSSHSMDPEHEIFDRIIKFPLVPKLTS